MVSAEDWEKVADTALDALKSDDWREEFSKVFKVWREISKKYIPTVPQKDILDAYTELGSLPTETDTVGQFRMFEEFCDCLHEHTDRMWFNPWMRCQIIIQNLNDLIKED